MTYGTLRRFLRENTARADLEHNHHDWINEALLKIQTDHDWWCMRRTNTQVPVPSGAQHGPIPGRFKKLGEEEAQVTVSTAADPASRFPCEVRSHEWVNTYPGSANIPLPPADIRVARTGIPVWIEQDSANHAVLHLTAPAGEDLIFWLTHYEYLPDLEKDDDQNWFTVNLARIVRAQLKAIAFGWINDVKQAAAAEEEYQFLLRREIAVDVARRFSGRKLRMGG